MGYPNAKFLIYTKWKRDLPFKIAGSLLLDCALTEEEAKEKVELYKGRHDEYDAKFPMVNSDTVTQFIYITNRPEWWSQ
jgi:hypothetical protein